MKTQEQLRQDYQVLTSKVGDLYFVLSHARDQLRQLETQMAAFHAEREEIQKAFVALAGTPVAAPDAVEAPPAN